MKQNYLNPYVASAGWKKSLLVLKVTTFLLAAASMPAAAVAYSLETNVDFVKGSLAPITVSGRVVDEKGEAIPGATVKVKGSNQGSITDTNGRFTLQNVDEAATLVVSYVGYDSRELKVSRSAMVISLTSQSNNLNDVVVVGYGSQKKVNLTGAVSTVDAKALESRPVQNVGQALQGLIPGLNFQTGGLGGELNQNLSFNIRGTGTIGAGSSSSPLVLIDGMEGDMNTINPQDIETVTVLKDAAASSIYGSRAPFGVVLITTKKGKMGTSSVSYSNNFRWTKPMGLPTMMDSYTFANYWNEAAANGGESPKFAEDVLDRILKYQKGEIDYTTIADANGDKWQYYTGSNANTNWFKEQYRDYSFSQDHSINISGGTEKTQYFVSGGFMDQGGITTYSGDAFKRYSLTGKVSTALSKFAKFNYTSRFIREDYTKASHQNDLFYHNVARRWPTVPVKDPNGFYSDPSEIAQTLDGGRVINQRDILFQQAQLILTPAKGWNIVADGNVRITNRNNHEDILPAYGYNVAGNRYPLAVGYNAAEYSYVYEFNDKANYFTGNVYTDYEFKFNDAHNFKVLAGFNTELNKLRTLGASRSGLITPELPTINTSTADSRATEGAYQNWATTGFFSRLNYNFKERYLLEINARYDGSSRFLRDQRWNLFPSFSAGWNVAQEDFWMLKDYVQVFKIRGSYGELGNQNTNLWYPFFTTMPVGVTNGNWLLNGQRPNTSSSPGLVSTMLTWERIASWNIGFDMAMMKNRLSLSFDYYKRNTFDMVGPAPELPVILGTAVPRVNNADMESYGFEVEAKWQDRIGDFGYSIRGILSDDQQRVTNYPNPTGNIAEWYNNKMNGEIWGYTTVGIAKTQAEMDAHLATTNQNAMGGNWTAGDIMYKDINGDGKIDGGAGVLGNTGDRSIIGNSSLRYRFSLDLSMDYKGFDFRAFFQGVGKRDYMPNGPYFWGASGGMWQSAGFTEHMDYFRDENSVMVASGLAGVNTDPYFAKPYFTTTKNQQTQTRYIQNGAYIRLKNLQLGYSLPKTVTSKVGIARARFYLSGDNLFTITKMSKIFDPETVGLSGYNDGKTYPLAQVYSCGVNITF
jgi:TonB-linked SusC/RagA family outer membrane protein